VRIAVIVNADDLGMSEHVNDAVFGLMTASLITSGTIMANAPAVRSAVTSAQRFPSCSFGVHLNLTQFEPLTGGAGAKLLVDQTGRMSRAIESAPLSVARMSAIYEEMCAQVERLVSWGMTISHFDSHNHVHTKPLFFLPLKAVQRRFAVRVVRISKNFYSAEEPCPPALYRKKHAYNWALRHLYRTTTTQAFAELTTFCSATRQQQLAYESVELMVHPGAATAESETRQLQSRWFDTSGLPIELLNYSEFAWRRR